MQMDNQNVKSDVNSLMFAIEIHTLQTFGNKAEWKDTYSMYWKEHVIDQKCLSASLEIAQVPRLIIKNAIYLFLYKWSSKLFFLIITLWRAKR